MFRTTLFCFSFALAPVCAQSADDWQVVGAPAISDGPALCCQIAIDANEDVYIAYQDLSLGTGQASVSRFTHGGWRYAGMKGDASIGRAWYNTLAFDAGGALYIANRDYAHSGRINVRRFDPSLAQWSNIGPSGSSPSEAHYTDIKLGHNHVPYVVYADRSTTPIDRATAMRFENGAWYLLQGFGFSTSGAGYTSLALDSHDVPFVAFSDADHPDASQVGRVSVMRYDGATDTWHFVGAPGFSALGGLNVRIAIDHHDVPYIVYQQYHTRLVVMKFDGVQWVQVGGSASAADHPDVQTEPWRQWLSLAFDSQDEPYVAYELLDDGLKAAVRRFDGMRWSQVGRLGFSDGAADYMALAIDGDDVPYVVYRDGAHNGRATVMRFAPRVTSYCTGSASSQGCVATIDATGTPSASGASAFDIVASGVIPNRTGLLLYGPRPGQMPFQGGALCLAPPVARTAPQNSGGMLGVNCSGSFAFDFNTLVQAGTHSDLAPGSTVFAQYWYRDSLSGSGPSLSNALRFTIGP